MKKFSSATIVYRPYGAYWEAKDLRCLGDSLPVTYAAKSRVTTIHWDPMYILILRGGKSRVIRRILPSHSTNWCQARGMGSLGWGLISKNSVSDGCLASSSRIRRFDASGYV